MPRVRIAYIREDDACQPRAGLSQDTIDDYAALLSASKGAALPHVIVFFDSIDYYLADGYHRIAAHRKAGIDDIEAEVRPGELRDAILYSLGANKEHGLRRTNADKRRAVERMLSDEEWSRWADRRIADHCGVSHFMVSDVRQKLIATGRICQLENEKRIGLDGRERSLPTGNGYQLSGPRIDGDVRDYVQQHMPQIAESGDEVAALAALTFQQQRDAIDMVLGGGAETVCEARQRIAPEVAPSAPAISQSTTQPAAPQIDRSIIAEAAREVAEAAATDPVIVILSEVRFKKMMRELLCLSTAELTALRDWIDRRIGEMPDAAQAVQ
jgi:hypothetical protein